MDLMLLFGEPLWVKQFPNLGLLDRPFLILRQMRKCIEGSNRLWIIYIIFQEHLVNINASPIPHWEPMSAILPHLLESTPSRYYPLSSSQLTPSLTSLARGSIVHDSSQSSNPVTTVSNPGSTSGSLVPSTTGEKPPSQVASIVSGVTSSTRHTPTIG